MFDDIVFLNAHQWCFFSLCPLQGALSGGGAVVRSSGSCRRRRSSHLYSTPPHPSEGRGQGFRGNPKISQRQPDPPSASRRKKIPFTFHRKRRKKGGVTFDTPLSKSSPPHFCSNETLGGTQRNQIPAVWLSISYFTAGCIFLRDGIIRSTTREIRHVNFAVKFTECVFPPIHINVSLLAMHCFFSLEGSQNEHFCPLILGNAQRNKELRFCD